MADASQPRSNMIALIGVIVAVVLFAVTVASLQFVAIVVQREVRRKVELAPTSALDALRAEETLKLNQPAYVDRGRGIVRIPIQLAIELEAARPWRLDLPRPTPTPSAGDAASTGTAAGGGESER